MSPLKTYILLLTIGSGFSARIPRSEEVSGVILNAQCVEDAECIPLNSECNEECTCKTGFIAYDMECYELPTLGTSCYEDERCEGIGNAVCLDDKCSCAEGFVEEDDKCLKLATSKGESCETDAQCSKLTGMECQEGRCLVWPQADRGESCTEDDDCSTPMQLKCVSEVCECSEEMIWSSLSAECLPLATINNNNCSEDVQCSKLNTTCSIEDGICVLLAPPNDVVSLALGSPCTQQEDCSPIENAVCDDNVCNCNVSFVTNVNDDKCLPIAETKGDPCEEDKQCEGLGVTCMMGICEAEKQQKPRAKVFKTAAAGIGGTGNDASRSTTALAFIILPAVVCLMRS